MLSCLSNNFQPFSTNRPFLFQGMNLWKTNVSFLIMSFSLLSYFPHLSENHSQTASSAHIENYFAVRKIKMLQQQCVAVWGFHCLILSHPLIPVSHVLSILMEPCLGFADTSSCTHSHLRVGEFPGTNSSSPVHWSVAQSAQRLHARRAGLESRRGQIHRRTELKCEHPSAVTCFQFERCGWTL